MYLAVLASLIHGFTVPAGIEYGMRLRGFTKGRFEWFKSAPWGDPGFSALWMSLAIFGFLGGITGVTLGAEQINIVAHNTLRITGHFHVTATGGAALSFMAISYYIVPLFFRKRIVFWKLAKIQPYIFGFGISIMGMSMITLGALGIPRRHWDVSFASALFDVQFPPISYLIFALMGVAGTCAALGGFLFAVIILASMFFGKDIRKIDFNEREVVHGIPQGITLRHKREYSEKEVETIHQSGGAKGTVILIIALLVCFILFYFANWQLLSSTWKVG